MPLKQDSKTQKTETPPAPDTPQVSAEQFSELREQLFGMIRDSFERIEGQLETSIRDLQGAQKKGSESTETSKLNARDKQHIEAGRAAEESAAEQRLRYEGLMAKNVNLWSVEDKAWMGTQIRLAVAQMEAEQQAASPSDLNELRAGTVAFLRQWGQ
jgi:hypothetical protein